MRHPVIPRGYCKEDWVEASLNGLVSPGSTFGGKEHIPSLAGSQTSLPSLIPPSLEDLQSSLLFL